MKVLILQFPHDADKRDLESLRTIVQDCVKGVGIMPISDLVKYEVVEFDSYVAAKTEALPIKREPVKLNIKERLSDFEKYCHKCVHEKESAGDGVCYGCYGTFDKFEEKE